MPGKVSQLAPRTTRPGKVNAEEMNAKELALLTYNAVTAQTAVIESLVTAVGSLTSTQQIHSDELFRRLGVDAQTASLTERVKLLETTLRELPDTLKAELRSEIQRAADEAKSSARTGAMVGGGVVSIIAEAIKAAAGA